MGSCGVVRGRVGSCGVMWSRRGSYGVVWGRVRSCGVAWGRVRSRVGSCDLEQPVEAELLVLLQQLVAVLAVLGALLAASTIGP
eukprot:4588155-Prymnesium_polylepis.1